MAFMAKRTFDGLGLRVLTIVDPFSRVRHGWRYRYTGDDGVRTLEKATGHYGISRTIRVDNGPEFVLKAGQALWACANEVTWASHAPQRPQTMRSSMP